MKYNRSAIILIATLFVAKVAFAKEQLAVAYPPYTEIWGIDIAAYPSMHKAQFSSTDIDVYSMPNGDVSFIFTVDAQKEMSERQYALLTFFAGQKNLLNGEELNRFGARYRMNKLHFLSPKSVNFTDGTAYKTVYADNASVCESRLRNYVSVVKGDKEVDGFVFLYRVDHTKEEPSFCKEEGGEAVNVIVKVKSTTFEMIPLKDGTFIGFNQQMITRFNKGFITPYPAFNTHVWVIKKRVLQQIIAGAKTGQEQQDRVAAWLDTHPLPYKGGH